MTIGWAERQGLLRRLTRLTRNPDTAEDCLQSALRPNWAAVCAQSCSTSASVAWPYFSGSRVPNKLRFGPLST